MIFVNFLHRENVVFTLIFFFIFYSTITLRYVTPHLRRVFPTIGAADKFVSAEVLFIFINLSKPIFSIFYYTFVEKGRVNFEAQFEAITTNNLKIFEKKKNFEIKSNTKKTKNIYFMLKKSRYFACTKKLDKILSQSFLIIFLFGK